MAYIFPSLMFVIALGGVVIQFVSAKGQINKTKQEFEDKLATKDFVNDKISTMEIKHDNLKEDLRDYKLDHANLHGRDREDFLEIKNTLKEIYDLLINRQ